MTQVDPNNPANKQVNPTSFANSIGNFLQLLSQPASGGTGTAVGPLSGQDSISQVQTTPLTQTTSTPTDTSAGTSPSTPITDSNGTSSNPLPGSNYTIGQGYGGQSGHPGIDLDVPVGTTAVAAISGKVTVASGGQGGYGNLVEIQGANGVKIRYGHLSYIGTKVGATVTAGQPIGKTGGQAGAPGAGNSTGPHLHFEVDLPQGGTTDPTPYLAGGAQIIKGQAAPDLSAAQPAPAPADPRDVGATAGQRLQGALIGQDPGSALQAAAPQQAAQQQPGQTQQPAGTPDAILRQAMQITGVPQDWYPYLVKIMMRESGGQNIPQAIHDVNTDKGTPAFGPMQIIEPTFNANKLPGYGDWHNPLDSTIAAIRYIQSRYGNPVGPSGPGGY